MTGLKRLAYLSFALILFATACLPQPTPTPGQTPGSGVPTTGPAATPTPTAPPAKMAPLFEQGITTEPLSVISTLPADKANEIAVDRAATRLVVQFNHPVVPLASVTTRATFTQPLAVKPALSGTGEWLNSSTYAFTPSQDLQVATDYSVSVAPQRDLMGMDLSAYTWTFRTTAPAIAKMYPASGAQDVAVSLPISLTFNADMDRASVESRFYVTAGGTAVTGAFDWRAKVVRFAPARPLAYDTLYTVRLASGAAAAAGSASTPADVTWTFRTVKRPAVLAMDPADSSRAAKPQLNGLKITFASPMDPDSLSVTIVPTVTNQRSSFRFDLGGTVALVNGGWLPSQAYTVTVGGQSKTREGERLGNDVTIRFTTAPADPQLYFSVPDYANFAMYDAGVPAVVYASVTNVERVNYRLYRVPRANVLSLLGANSYQVWRTYAGNSSDLVRQWSEVVNAPLNASRFISTSLSTSTDGLLKAGVYYLEATAAGVSQPARHLLFVTSVNLALKHTDNEALVWATSLATGKPVPGLSVSFYSPAADASPESKGSSGQALALAGSATSDTEGLVRVKFPRALQPWQNVYALVEAGGQIVGAAGTDWSNGISPWDYGLSSGRGALAYYANLYTDRAIYRPGQIVYYKGIVRSDNDAAYSLPDLSAVNVQVRDPEYRQVFSGSLKLGDFGSFDGSLDLSEGAATGEYSMFMQIGDRPYAGTSFLVAEYRRPDFQVTVTPDKPEYVNGETVRAEATASYFFGGPVADAAVTWRLTSSNYFFSPDSVKGWWDFADWDYFSPETGGSKVIRDGKGKTDAQGKFAFDLPADVSEFRRSQVFELEAEVTDLSNQAVAGRVRAVVHRGQFYVGLRPQQYVGASGQEQAVDVITVNTKGLGVAQQSVDLQFFRREWYSVREKQADSSFQWKSSFTDTLVSKVSVRTDGAGAAVGRFTPTSGGTYRVLATATDGSGNQIRSATYLWVTDAGFVSWRMEDNDRIDLIADKKEYAPGDVAEILVPAPFSQAEALLTIERGSIREVRRLFLAGNSERVKVPITSDYAPNVFVSVMMVKGRGPDSPLPQFKMGYVNLSVSAAEKQLAVTITTDRERYAPGEQATFTVQASQVSGAPAQAEFSLALVDKAVQSLADDRSLAPASAFWGQRGLAVVTGTSLARFAERANQTTRDAGGKGGGGAQLNKPVRQDFRDTAYWNARVVTDSAGKATATVTLPDNLTTWNMTAKGVTKATLVGQAAKDILSTKALLVRPVTPRFFVAGDKATLEAVINNSTDSQVSVNVRLDAVGLTLAAGAQQPLSVKANGSAKVSWEVTANAASAADIKVTFAAEGGGLQDAVALTIPVRRPTSPETVGTAGQVETRIVEKVDVPPAADKTAGGLRVSVSPSLAAASRESLHYLQSFEYECTEQTVSRFFPNAVTYLALKKLGIDREDLRKGLSEAVLKSVPKLYGAQNRDGGWGWWSGDASRPMLTAYALLALNTARQAGFAVDSDTTFRAEQYLVNWLNQPVRSGDAAVYNERAFVVFVLAEIGRKDMVSRASTLYDQRANLDLYAKAYLLMALKRGGQPQSASLASDISAAAIASSTGTHWEEKNSDYAGMNTNTRTTALVLMALNRSDPKNALLANAVRWLMVARRDGHWETTQVTAWSVMALTEYMVGTGELAGNYAYEVAVNGKPLGSVSVDKTNVDETRQWTVAMADLAQSVAAELSITRAPGEGKLYYSAYLDYFLPAGNLAALNRGILVGRQYFAVDAQTLKVSDRQIESAQIGDYVQVRLTLVAPSDLHYLVLEDSLPAGCEAVDNTLKTATTAATGPVLKGGITPEPAAPAGGKYWQPYWQYWAHTDVRDDRVAVFATELGRGVYEYTYTIRASVAGQFRALPATAWEMYFPDVFGRSASTVLTVR